MALRPPSFQGARRSGMPRLRGTRPALSRSSPRSVEEGAIMATSETKDSNPAKESLRREQEAQRRQEREKGKNGELEKALEDTFPASDPVAMQTPIKPGGKDK
jgi:hypothetical protein